MLNCKIKNPVYPRNSKTTCRRTEEPQLQALNLNWEQAARLVKDRERLRGLIDVLCASRRRKERWWSPPTSFPHPSPLPVKLNEVCNDQSNNTVPWQTDGPSADLQCVAHTDHAENNTARSPALLHSDFQGWRAWLLHQLWTWSQSCCHSQAMVAKIKQTDRCVCFFPRSEVFQDLRKSWAKRSVSLSSWRCTFWIARHDRTP